MLVSLTGCGKSLCVFITSMSARAGLSWPPPGGVPATSSISWVGTQPVTSCMLLLLLRIESAEHLRPQHDFIFVKLLEINRAALVRRRHVVTQLGKALHHLRVGQ